MKQKFLKVSLLVVFIVACVFSLSPKARAITANELQQQITALLAQIASLQQQLAQIQGNQGVAWCHTFNTNLGIGSKGTETQELVKALGKDGILMQGGCAEGGACQYFDEYVASIVVEFQEKYASEVLGPYGLKHGTGYVGKTTRAKLNKLYSCNNQPVACAQDAKQCPDGSSVSRVAPDCEFAECPVTTTTCAKEGEGTLSWKDSLTCCAGLKKIGNPAGYGDSCSMNLSSGSICSYCGNGVCGLGENKCNCPGDCKEITPVACADTDGGDNRSAQGIVIQLLNG